MIKGGCACGRIQYQSAAQPLSVNACHCGTCQKVSGCAFLGFVDVPASELQWTKGQQPEMWSRSEIAERGYCKVCGSTMSMRYHLEPERIGVTLGSVVEAEPALPGLSAHIFLKEKAPWFVLPEDGAERWDEFPPGFQDMLERWNKGDKSSGRAGL